MSSMPIRCGDSSHRKPKKIPFTNYEQTSWRTEVSSGPNPTNYIAVNRAVRQINKLFRASNCCDHFLRKLRDFFCYSNKL